MNRANADIRTAAKESGVKLWEIAREFGFTDHYFSKLMRNELPLSQKVRAFDAIEKIKSERG